MNMLQYSIHFYGFLMLVGLRLMPNVYKGHGEVKVGTMLLLIANNCWTRSFALGYWLFYFSSVFDSDEKRKPFLIYPCPYWGQSIYVTVGNYIVSSQLIAGSIMVRHMILIIFLSLPLTVFTSWGVHITLFGESLWTALIVHYQFWLCLLFLARSARCWRY
jgi:hypothetical protein